MLGGELVREIGNMRVEFTFAGLSWVRNILYCSHVLNTSAQRRRNPGWYAIRLTSGLSGDN